MPTKPKKVAVIQDWLVTYRGGEIVLDAILELYPDADVFCMFHEPGKEGPVAARHAIKASFLNNRFLRRRYRHCLPLMPIAVERFDLSSYDLVISSSHCVAKGVIPSPGAMHVCYSHTPMRYAWDRYHDYFSGAFEFLFLPFLHYLRMWDVTSSARVDHFIANSSWTQKRIERFYRRDAKVIPPFVDFEAFKTATAKTQDYYLVVSGFAPNKRIDLAILACQKLGRRLIVVGEGQEAAALRRLSLNSTEFPGRVSLEKLKQLYAGSKALLFPGEEDFGIAPLEAMACGRPVIAFGRGGVTDSVIDGQTGLLFPEQTVESLAKAILDFESNENSFSPEKCRTRASEFTRERFQKDFKRQVDEWWRLRHPTRPLDLEIEVELDTSP